MTMQLAARQSSIPRPVTQVTGTGAVVSGRPSERSRAPKVLHITPSIGGGGAEAMLCNLVQTMHGGAWRSVVVAVNGSAWPERAAHLKHFTEDFYDLEAPSLLKPSVWSRIRAIIAAEKPDVVQTWMHHADFVGGLCAWICGIKHIVWGIHCREIHRHPGESALRSFLFRKGLKIMSKFIPERIVSCSLAAIEDHKAMGYPEHKTLWIPNGIRTERFVPGDSIGAARRAELGLPADAEVIGLVGRFHEMKRLDWFFQAVKILSTTHPDAHYIVCGGDAADLDEKATAAYLEVPDKAKIHFLPFHADIQRLYPAMSVFTLTSRTEACPMTILEAMSCGVPCVATDVGDCARLIQDPSSIAPAGDVAALAAAWARSLALGPGQRADLGRQLRERAENDFSIARAARAYETAYDDLISTPAK